MTVSPPRRGDAARLVAGRDAEFHRFLGPGADEPDPVACVRVDGDVVGWVDHDAERSWLLDGEVNVGYNVFAGQRGRGIASRAVQLLMHHLAVTEQCRTATLLIDADNVRSQALADRTGFVRCGDLDGDSYYKRTVPPLSYQRDDVIVRRRHRDDAALSAHDGEHLGWSWLPEVSDSFGVGPRWSFSIDLADASSVGGVDVNLSSGHAPAGEADVSCWVRPELCGRGIAPVAVHLALQFLREHSGTRRAHILVDPNDTPSLTLVASFPVVGASTVVRHGRSLRRHSLDL